MRNVAVKKLFALAILVLFSSAAGAVGMGNVNVLSSLGQTLNVEIEIISVSPQERDTLSAKLGSPRSYERSSLPMGAAGVSGVRVSLERRTNGEPYIRVTSAKPVLEPFINLVIELISVSGPVSREFAILLDPPEYTPPKSVEATPAPAVAAPEIKKPVPPPPPVQAAESDYGPVRPGETLSRIAAKVRPQNTTLEQTMLGIFRNNPAAFINNNMNLLKAGQRLRIPAADQIAALPQADSTQALRTHTTAWTSHRPVPTAEAVAPKPRTPPAEKQSVAAKPASGGKPVVKLSRGGVAGKDTSIEDRVRMLEEDLAARERALNDANERIKRLERAASGAPAAGERSGQK